MSTETTLLYIVLSEMVLTISRLREITRAASHIEKSRTKLPISLDNWESARCFIVQSNRPVFVTMILPKYKNKLSILMLCKRISQLLKKTWYVAVFFGSVSAWRNLSWTACTKLHNEVRPWVNKLTSLKRIQMKGLLLSVEQSKLRKWTALLSM